MAQALVCKTKTRRFDSVRYLHLFRKYFMPFIRVSPYLGEKTKRYINTSHITAVIGPNEIEKPIGPGKTRTTYDVEIQVVGNITHTTHCPTVEIAEALVRLAVSEGENDIKVNQASYNGIHWPKAVVKD